MVEAVNISKTFGNTTIIDNFNAKVHPGDFISITGESGKGKTTILNLMGLLEKPSKGDVIVEGIANPNKKETLLLQRNKFGYLFQNYALIESETVTDNLVIALKYRGKVDKKEEVKKALSFVNLDGFENKKVYELSGGEQQRIALARIIIKDCIYIFADEPTGNLDLKNRDLVFDILKKLNIEGKSVIYVTHDLELAKKSNELINLDKIN